MPAVTQEDGAHRTRSCTSSFQGHETHLSFMPPRLRSWVPKADVPMTIYNAGVPIDWGGFRHRAEQGVHVRGRRVLCSQPAVSSAWWPCSSPTQGAAAEQSREPVTEGRREQTPRLV